MDTDLTPLERAVQRLSASEIARVCGVSHTAVHLWRKTGFLPRTEFTGETSYAAAIEAATNGDITRGEILAAHNRGSMLEAAAPRGTPLP